LSGYENPSCLFLRGIVHSIVLLVSAVVDVLRGKQSGFLVLLDESAASAPEVATAVSATGTGKVVLGADITSLDH